MNIPIEQFIPSGAGLIATIVGLIGIWFKFQNKVERLEDDKNEMKRQINAFWSWKDEHEKSSSSVRELLHKEISELKGSLLVTGEQFRQIMLMLNDIKDRISRLEDGHSNHAV